MRILAGRWAGTPLTSPGGRVRPTAEALRDEWLTLLADALPKARVLDLYAGTGALGLEALSRGVARVDFVENQADALHALKANIARVRARDRVRIFKRDALRFAAALDANAYDLAFADPPYGSRQADRLVERWLEVPFARRFSIEHAADHPLAGGRTRVFGDSALTFYGPAS